MEEERPLQDDIDNLTHDFASFYTAVERRTRPETTYRDDSVLARGGAEF
jgi:hypothetical protein